MRSDALTSGSLIDRSVVVEAGPHRGRDPVPDVERPPEGLDDRPDDDDEEEQHPRGEEGVRTPRCVRIPGGWLPTSPGGLSASSAHEMEDIRPVESS